MRQAIRSFLMVAGFAGVLLAGQPLADTVADSATGYMEWLLEVKFNGEQRQRYRRILEATFAGGNSGAINGVVSMAKAYDRLASETEQAREAKREVPQREFVKLLRQAGDEDSRWLLAIHESRVAAAAGRAGGLSGRWTNGRVSMIQYENRYTGVAAPTNGNSFAYEFQPGGTYVFTGLIQSVMYNCTTTMFAQESGTYQFDGGVLSLHPEKNPYTYKNSCAPSSNKEGPGKLTDRKYRVRFTQDSGSELIELTGEDGQAQKFSKSR
ncbi:MAG: hypothetical protein JNK87_16495 [Bryobacterales bacterium]|nr:hypothetical protein [Bryobacterales bacterium]